MVCMKKRKTLIISAALMILLIFLLPYGQCEETDDDEEIIYFSSIQKAINNASEGDTVYIYGGDYYEDIIVINKSIILEGKELDGFNPVIFGNISIISNNVTISNLYIKNGRGIRITGFPGSMDFVVYENITIKQNVIKNNSEYGIDIRFADDINIINNIFEENNGGIAFQYWVKNSIIQGNTFNENQEYAIYIRENQTNNFNMFYHNSFTNNTNNAYDGGINFWNASDVKEGNYWDDYTALDKNNNGIGDTPYDIPGGDNVDEYPLMMPYDGTIRVKEFYVDYNSVFNMLIIGMIIAIAFVLPIAYYWRKKYFT